jgi:RNA polymerase sigma-70 factor (ECF subfamily)
MADLARGKKEALKPLFERYQAKVVTLAYSFLQDQGGAEDVAQETFLRILSKARYYRPRGRFPSWLYRIVVNLCRDRLRGKSRHLTLSLSAGGTERNPEFLQRWEEDSREPGTSAEELLVEKEVGEEVRRALELLPEGERSAIVLSQFHGLRYQEIAEILGVSVSAVKMRISRAREHLRRQLSR